MIELVEEKEDAFAEALRAGEFERVRDGLHVIADSIVPGGALGAGDAADNSRKAAKRTRRNDAPNVEILEAAPSPQTKRNRRTRR